MANVDVSGFAQFSDGTSVPLFNDSMAEGTLVRTADFSSIHRNGPKPRKLRSRKNPG